MEQSTLPSNSLMNQKEVTKHKKEISPVVSGKVKKKGKSFGKRVVDSFINEEVDDVKGYLISDVLIPTVKKTILDVIRMFFYGRASNPDGSIITPYNTMSRGRTYLMGSSTMPNRISKKTFDDIRDSLAEDRVKANPISDDIYNEHINSYDGKQWFHDSMTGQYFRSTDAAVDRIFIDLNNKILDELYVQHGELLMTLGEASGKMFETNGWEIGEKVDVRKTYMTCNGEVMVDIEYTRPHPI